MVKVKRQVDRVTRRPSSAPLPPRRRDSEQQNNSRNNNNNFVTRQLQSISLHDNDNYDSDDDDDEDVGYKDLSEHQVVVVEKEMDQTNFDTSSWCCRTAEGKILFDDNIRQHSWAFQDSSNALLIMEPPRIKRTSSAFDLRMREKCFEKNKNQNKLKKRDILEQSRSQSLNRMETWELQGAGDDSDESTVVISNIHSTSNLVPSKAPLVTTERKIGNSERHESLIDVFQIKLSTPLKLPKEKRWSNKLNELIHSSPSHRSVNAAANDVLAGKKWKR
jgi:hypothetical protein